MHLILAIILLGIAFLLLSLRLIIKKEKGFKSTHVEDSEALRQQGIKCAKAQMKEEGERKDLFDLISDNN